MSITRRYLESLEKESEDGRLHISDSEILQEFVLNRETVARGLEKAGDVTRKYFNKVGDVARHADEYKKQIMDMAKEKKEYLKKRFIEARKVTGEARSKLISDAKSKMHENMGRIKNERKTAIENKLRNQTQAAEV